MDTENPWETWGNPGMNDAFHGKRYARIIEYINGGEQIDTSSINGFNGEFLGKPWPGLPEGIYTRNGLSSCHQSQVRWDNLRLWSIITGLTLVGTAILIKLD